MRNCHRKPVVRLRASALVLVIVTCLAAGCGSDQLPCAPAAGKVLLDGKPLEFGAVMFQPEAGRPARGTIGPDGSFTLGTYSESDGAIIGKHSVRITCFESQRPGHTPDLSEGEPGVGESLIPAKYQRPELSKLEAEVKDDNEPFVFNLTSE